MRLLLGDAQDRISICLLYCDRLNLSQKICIHKTILKVWRECEMKLARYHVEACDNAKYLGATEQYSHRIYLEVTH